MLSEMASFTVSVACIGSVLVGLICKLLDIAAWTGGMQCRPPG